MPSMNRLSSSRFRGGVRVSARRTKIILTEDGEQDDVCHVAEPVRKVRPAAEPVRRVRPVRRASPVWSVRTHVANAARVAELERQVAELVATVEELRQQTDNEGDDGER